MEDCKSCLSRRKKRSRNKHEHLKKHEYFSNLIIGKYSVSNPEINKPKDIIQPYYDKQK